MVIRSILVSDKLLFAGLRPDYLSLRTSAPASVAIHRLEGKYIDNRPAEWGKITIFGGNRYLVPFIRGIATEVLRTGLQ